MSTDAAKRDLVSHLPQILRLPHISHAVTLSIQPLHRVPRRREVRDRRPFVEYQHHMAIPRERSSPNLQGSLLADLWLVRNSNSHVILIERDDLSVAEDIEG